MKRGITTLLSVAGSLVFATGSQAITEANPYQPIIKRNVFGLNPPPPPPGSLADAAPPPPTIFLTGITTVLGNKRALLVFSPAVRPGEKPVQESYILTEGERDGEVEVVQIDEQKGAVKIRLAGKEMDLDFDRNGIKIASAPPSAPNATALPSLPIRPGGAIPPPQTRSFGNAFGGVNNIPTMPRTIRPGGSETTLGSSTSSGQNTTSGSQESLSHQEQVALMEIERERTREQVLSGSLPPLPPTPQTPLGAP